MAEYDEMIGYIRQEIITISERAGLPEGFFTLSENKNGSTSLWIIEPLSKRKSRMIFCVEQRGKKGNKYISVTTKSSKASGLTPPDSVEVNPDLSNSANIRINFAKSSSEIVAYLHDLIVLYVNQFEPSDKFGCCHRFKECSDAKKCLHPDQFYSKACWYRKNLENGKIFY